MSRSELQTSKKISHFDIENTKMFCDRSMDSVEFQQKIQYYRFIYSCTDRDTHLGTSTLSKNKRSIDRNTLKEVPTIEYLREQVNLRTDCMNVKRVQNSSMYWNSMFRQIVKLCHLECDFPPWVMPSCYTKEHTCRHTLQVEFRII